MFARFSTMFNNGRTGRAGGNPGGARGGGHGSGDTSPSPSPKKQCNRKSNSGSGVDTEPQSCQVFYVVKNIYRILTVLRFVVEIFINFLSG